MMFAYFSNQSLSDRVKQIFRNAIWRETKCRSRLCNRSDGNSRRGYSSLRFINYAFSIDVPCRSTSFLYYCSITCSILCDRRTAYKRIFHRKADLRKASRILQSLYHTNCVKNFFNKSMFGNPNFSILFFNFILLYEKVFMIYTAACKKEI